MHLPTWIRFDSILSTAAVFGSDLLSGSAFVEMGGQASQPQQRDDAHAAEAEETPHDSCALEIPPSSGQAGIARIASRIESVVPTIFTWGLGGQDVHVTGAWDNWAVKVPLTRSGAEHVAVLSLPVGSYQYKFIVDGNWKHNPALSTETDQHGNLNNVVLVSPQYPEYDSNEPLSATGGPPSPIESYDFSMPAHEDYAVEPTLLPSLFKVAPLTPDEVGVRSPNPSFYVALNHLFHVDPEDYHVPVKTVASINRYKATKLITTVMVLSNASQSSRPISVSASRVHDRSREMSPAKGSDASDRGGVHSGTKKLREMAVAGVNS